MKIIDFHTHIFPDALAQRAIAAFTDQVPEAYACTDGTRSGLRASMRKNGISISVLQPIATKPSQVSTINRGCAELAAPDIIPFGTMHPQTVDIDNEIECLVSQNIRGVKMHPEYQEFYIDKREYYPLYDALSSAGLIAVFHAGKDPGPFTCDHATPKAFATVHRNFPNLKIVAAHMGGWQLWDDVFAITAGLPIYFDTAAVREYLPANDFARLVRKHGVDHVLFGSDSPWYDPGIDIRWIDELDLSEKEKENIFYNTAANLLCL